MSSLVLSIGLIVIASLVTTPAALNPATSPDASVPPMHPSLTTSTSSTSPTSPGSRATVHSKSKHRSSSNAKSNTKSGSVPTLWERNMNPNPDTDVLRRVRLSPNSGVVVWETEHKVTAVDVISGSTMWTSETPSSIRHIMTQCEGGSFFLYNGSVITARFGKIVAKFDRSIDVFSCTSAVIVGATSDGKKFVSIPMPTDTNTPGWPSLTAPVQLLSTQRDGYLWLSASPTDTTVIMPTSRVVKSGPGKSKTQCRFTKFNGTTGSELSSSAWIPFSISNGWFSPDGAFYYAVEGAVDPFTMAGRIVVLNIETGVLFYPDVMSTGAPYVPPSTPGYMLVPVVEDSSSTTSTSNRGLSKGPGANATLSLRSIELRTGKIVWRTPTARVAANEIPPTGFNIILTAGSLAVYYTFKNTSPTVVFSMEAPSQVLASKRIPTSASNFGPALVEANPGQLGAFGGPTAIYDMNLELLYTAGFPAKIGQLLGSSNGVLLLTNSDASVGAIVL